MILRSSRSQQSHEVSQEVIAHLEQLILDQDAAIIEASNRVADLIVQIDYARQVNLHITHDGLLIALAEIDELLLATA